MIKAFLNYARRDRTAAALIASRLEEDGIYIDSDQRLPPGVDYRTAITRAIETADCIIVLWSASASQSEYAAIELKQAIKAWSEDRLVLVALDDTPLPMGLRDQHAVRFTGRERDAIEEITRAVRERVPHREPSPPRAAAAPAPMQPAPARRVEYAPETSRASPFSVIRSFLIIAILAFIAAWIGYNTVGGAIDFLGPALVWIAVVLATAGIGYAAYWFYSRPRRDVAPKVEAPKAQTANPPANVNPSKDVFVSYSWQDSGVVDALVSRIEAAGYGVWIDRASRDGGSARYAGPIVRAIRSSKVVAVMCSNNAFGSDHVVREVYLAGDFKKPFLNVDLDGADVPDELLYFLTGFPKVRPAEFERDDFKIAMQRVVA